MTTSIMYDGETGQIQSTFQGEGDVEEDFILQVEDSEVPTDLAAYRVDLETLTLVPVERTPTSDDVTQERNRRIYTGCEANLGVHGTVWIQGDLVSIANLDSLALRANLRISRGITTPFIYRDARNDIFSLPPKAILLLWEIGAEYIENMYKSSWILKDGGSIPANFTNDAYWTG